VSARARQEESLALRRELGDQWGIAVSLHNLAVVAHGQGEFAFAKARWEESLAISRVLGDRTVIATTLNSLGALALDRGDFASAKAMQRESLALRRDLGDRRGITHTLDGLAQEAGIVGNSLRAATIWGATERLQEEIGCPMAPSELPRFNRDVAAARAALADDVAFDRAWQEGRALTLEQAIEFALQ
jgi:hypothetical protein